MRVFSLFKSLGPIDGYSWFGTRVFDSKIQPTQLFCLNVVWRAHKNARVNQRSRLLFIIPFSLGRTLLDTACGYLSTLD